MRKVKNKENSDGISYAEKFMINVLKQLKLDFKKQLSCSTFKWCKKYRYDFYFRYKNEYYIIETHGNNIMKSHMVFLEEL